MLKLIFWVVAGVIMFSPISETDKVTLSVALGCTILAFRQKKIFELQVETAVVQHYFDAALQLKEEK